MDGYRAGMEDAFFVPLAQRRYRPTDRVRGPWSADHMHGGPPSALLAHEMSAAARAAGFKGPALLSRITVELLSPIPVADVAVTATVERPGRQVSLLSATLAVDSVPVALARAWLIRLTELELPHRDAGQIPGEGRSGVPEGWGGGYIDSVEWRWVAGAMDQPGPATVWAQPRVPLVLGRELSGEERALLVADSGSGASSVLDLREFLFLNTELSVHLFRPPQGEQILLAAETTLNSGGIGLAATELADGAGVIGRGAQTLFVAPRDPQSR